MFRVRLEIYQREGECSGFRKFDLSDKPLLMGNILSLCMQFEIIEIYIF